MSAGSIRVFRPIARLAHMGRRTRSALSVLVLIACVAALALIVESQRPQAPSVSQKQSLELPGVDAKVAEIDRRSKEYEEAERDRAIAGYLAKRYRVSQELTREFVSVAFGASQSVGIDPLLIIAVMAVESRFNPIAESVAGAKGLMQIIPKYHADKLQHFGGEKAVFEPRANILVGSQILGEYIQRAGDVGQGLRIYGGGASDGESSYPARVLDEKRRLQQVAGPFTRATRQASSRNQVAL